jgi:hypothetical protein
MESRLILCWSYSDSMLSSFYFKCKFSKEYNGFCMEDWLIHCWSFRIPCSIHIFLFEVKLRKKVKGFQIQTDTVFYGNNHEMKESLYSQFFVYNFFCERFISAVIILNFALTEK